VDGDPCPLVELLGRLDGLVHGRLVLVHAALVVRVVRVEAATPAELGGLLSVSGRVRVRVRVGVRVRVRVQVGIALGVWARVWVGLGIGLGVRWP